MPYEDSLAIMIINQYEGQRTPLPNDKNFVHSANKEIIQFNLSEFYTNGNTETNFMEKSLSYSGLTR
jgi:hypothetical protein